MFRLAYAYYIIAIAAMLISCGGNDKTISKEALIEFKDSTYNFGEVKQSEGSVSHTFTFHNIGQQPLVIQKVETSCHCTIVEYSKEPVRTGKKGKLKVIFDAKGSLPVNFHKTITIYSNSSQGTTELNINGRVLPI